MAALLIAGLALIPVIAPERTVSELVFTPAWWILPLVLGTAGLLLLTSRRGIDRATGIFILVALVLPLSYGALWPGGPPAHALGFPFLVLMAVRVWDRNRGAGIAAVILVGMMLAAVPLPGLWERPLFLLWAFALCAEGAIANVP